MSLGPVDYYRDNARRCTEAAASSKSLDARQLFETCATVWKQLADDREHELAIWSNPQVRWPIPE